MRKAKSQELLFVSKATKDKLDALTAGVSIVSRTGYQIEELRAKATLDRLALARAMLDCAEAAFRLNLHRLSVSRAYYSMYHGLRATTFYVFGGDDHEKHADLPSKLPQDFPNRATWENALKSARLERNRADYDPYPKSDDRFKTVAMKITADAHALIPIIRKYLKQKGCTP
jgi:uncharacterized protein (UPF0332 family)